MHAGSLTNALCPNHNGGGGVTTLMNKMSMSRIGCVCIRGRKHIAVKCPCWCSHTLDTLECLLSLTFSTSLFGSERPKSIEGIIWEWDRALEPGPHDLDLVVRPCRPFSPMDPLTNGTRGVIRVAKVDKELFAM